MGVQNDLLEGQSFGTIGNGEGGLSYIRKRFAVLVAIIVLYIGLWEFMSLEATERRLAKSWCEIGWPWASVLKDCRHQSGT